MKKAIWLSDIHLNFLKEEGIVSFLASLKNTYSDSVWISGDIAQADTLIEYLSIIESEIKRSIYFVLGNHDYYLGSFDEVRSKIRKLCNVSERLCWLSDADVMGITPEAGLIGHDSWADGRFGNYESSDLLLNDYVLIKDFNPLLEEAKRDMQYLPGGISNIQSLFTSVEALQSRLKRMQALAEEAVLHIERYLPRALERYKKVFFLTHVPPFREACWHRGKISDDNGLPHFSTKCVGETIVRIMKRHPERHLTVLCGHTHSRAEVEIIENLTVFAAQAEYGKPKIQKVINI
jgi:Icc-related predicted phosphoesterase